MALFERARRRATLPLNQPDGVGEGRRLGHRNGSSAKTVLTGDRPLHIAVPRDRGGELESHLIGKHERGFTGFDDKITALYARGLAVREIQRFMPDLYGTEVTLEFISTVTGAELCEMTGWQGRPLEPRYPVIFFGAKRVKIWEDNAVHKKCCLLGLGHPA